MALSTTGKYVIDLRARGVARTYIPGHNGSAFFLPFSVNNAYIEHACLDGQIIGTPFSLAASQDVLSALPQLRTVVACEVVNDVGGLQQVGIALPLAAAIAADALVIGEV